MNKLNLRKKNYIHTTYSLKWLFNNYMYLFHELALDTHLSGYLPPHSAELAITIWYTTSASGIIVSLNFLNSKRLFVTIEF